MIPVRFLAVAAAEVTDATAWYRQRSPELGRRLHAAVGAVRADIGQWPSSHSPWPLPVGETREVRSAPVKDFPYRLIYQVLPNEIRVLACAHTSREPNYWVDRL